MKKENFPPLGENNQEEKPQEPLDLDEFMIPTVLRNQGQEIPHFKIEEGAEENPDNLLVPTLLRQALRGERGVKLTKDLAKKAVEMAVEAIAAGNNDFKDLLNAILKLNSGESLNEEEAEMIIDLIAQARKREKENL
ncbi:MAG: hypothetical protein KatS3mg098_236 [Candidatus Parcubacteria bacterium]|nr:MAG: hypothetical protein KatS3mg098_236 [Candidatus Parcubacteria bacterium]